MNDGLIEIVWWSVRWFSPKIINQFEWERPYLLYLICLVPMVFLLRWIFIYKRRQKLNISLPSGQLRSDSWAWLRHIPRILLATCMCLLIIALARPQTVNEQVNQWSEGIDIVIAIDISISMQMEDLQPNRLDAAKKTAIGFIDGRFNDRIGVVLFAGDAFSLCPLTTDKELLKSLINDINFDMIDAKGTAIGSALAVCTNRMRESTAKSKVIILLSDGDSNAGNIDPLTAAQLAQAYDLKIYTIVVGREGDVPYGKDFFGRTHTVQNNVDESTMREIAKIGKGQFYRVNDNRSLQMVFDQIDQYEKTEIKETRFKNTFDYYTIYVNWAIVLFLLWLVSKASPIHNILED